jgi:hypothetical protein
VNKSFMIFFLAAFILLNRCNYKADPVKEIDPGKFYQFVSSSPKEKVWNEIIDALTEQKLAIETTNKDSGFIATGITSFLNSYTWENKHRDLENPNALVVCSMNAVPFVSTPPVKPNSLTGQWVVFVKGEPGKAIVYIKLVNAAGQVVIENSDPLPVEQVSVETHNLRVESTGVFEKELEKAINK